MYDFHQFLCEDAGCRMQGAGMLGTRMMNYEWVYVPDLG